MTRFISHVHADLQRARYARRGATARPEDVPMGIHKVYERMEQVLLPAAVPLAYDLGTALAKRRSTFSCPNDVPLSLSDLGTLLGHALARRPGELRRNYPSGGGLYPIETYLIASELEGAQPGIFHYNPTLHALERLWDIPVGVEAAHLINGAPPRLVCSALLIFTSVWDRSSAKYGDFTYLPALLETGHMSENILLVATALGLETRPFIGFDDQKVTRLLDLDEEYEQAVHSITLARPGRA